METILSQFKPGDLIRIKSCFGNIFRGIVLKHSGTRTSVYCTDSSAYEVSAVYMFDRFNQKAVTSTIIPDNYQHFLESQIMCAWFCFTPTILESIADNKNLDYKSLLDKFVSLRDEEFAERLMTARQNPNLVCWPLFSSFYPLSEDLIREFGDKLYWPSIVKCQRNITDDVLLDNMSYIVRQYDNFYSFVGACSRLNRDIDRLGDAFQMMFMLQ